MTGEMTRRDFLKIGGISIAGVAVMGLPFSIGNYPLTTSNQGYFHVLQ